MLAVRVAVPDTVKKIEEKAFDECPVLTVFCSRDSYAWRYCRRNDIPVSDGPVPAKPRKKVAAAPVNDKKPEPAATQNKSTAQSKTDDKPTESPKPDKDVMSGQKKRGFFGWLFGKK